MEEGYSEKSQEEKERKMETSPRGEVLTTKERKEKEEKHKEKYDAWREQM